MIDRTRTRTRFTGIAAAAALALVGAACGADSPPDAAATTAPAASHSTPASTTSTPSTTTSPATTSPPVTTSPPTTERTVASTVAAPPRPTTTVDELVAVGGARMHVRCTGTGESTVLMIHGFGSDRTSFAGIEPGVVEMSRVCSSDRFGAGSSDAPPAVQTFATQARDLREALGALGEPGPFVVVGHSFGGDVAVTFASLYRSEVAGLLLLEASPWNWNGTVCSVEDDGSASADIWVQTCSMQMPPNNAEAIDGPASFAELAQVGPLGDMPLIVDTASVHDYTAPDFDPASSARLTDAWFDGQEHWAALSSNSRLIPVDGVGHNLHLDRPDLVIEQIAQLLSPPS